jgi:hypothetical protein
MKRRHRDSHESSVGGGATGKTPSHLTTTVLGSTASGRRNDHCGPLVPIFGSVHFPGDPSSHVQAMPCCRFIHDIAFHCKNSGGVVRTSIDGVGGVKSLSSALPLATGFQPIYRLNGLAKDCQDPGGVGHRRFGGVRRRHPGRDDSFLPPSRIPPCVGKRALGGRIVDQTGSTDKAIQKWEWKYDHVPHPSDCRNDTPGCRSKEPTECIPLSSPFFVKHQLW